MIGLAFKAALSFLAPWLSLALGVLKAVASTVWGFVKQPPGSYIALIVAVALAWMISGHIYYGRGKANCRAVQIVVHDKQIVYINAAHGASEARTTPHAADNQHNKEEVTHVAQAAAALPGAGDECIHADLADRLRDLH